MPEGQKDEWGVSNYDPDWRTKGAGVSIDAAAPQASEPVQTDEWGVSNYNEDWRQVGAPKEDNYDTGIGYAFMRGFERLRALPDVAQGDYEELAGHYQAMDQWQMSPEDAGRLEEIRNTEGFWKKAGELLMEPRLVLQTVAESLPMMAAPIAGALGGGLAGGAAAGAATGGVGAPVGAAAGAMAGGGLGSYFTEYYNSMGDYFSEKGVDLTNPAELKAAFQNEALMAGAREWANDRGIPIAVFDALSMGLAGRIAKPVSKMVGKVTGGRRIGAGVASELGMQAGFGMAGEAGAQLSSTGEIGDELDVLMEGFAELAPGVVEAGVGSYTQRKAAERKGAETDPTKSPLAALDQPAPAPYGAIPETDIDPETGEPVAVDPMERLGDQLYEDLGEEGPNTPQPDELDVLLGDLGEQLDQDLKTQEGIEEADLREATRQNEEMFEMERKRAAEQQAQREVEERAAYEQQADQIVAEGAPQPEGVDITGRAVAPPTEPSAETVTPQGLPVEGAPVDRIGGALSEGMRTEGPEGALYETGGRPRGTSMGEALRAAGVPRATQVPPDDDGPTGGGGAAAPQPEPPEGQEPLPDARDTRAAEALEAEAETTEADMEAAEERAAIREADRPAETEPTYDEIPYEPVGPEGPKPAVGWADERLADETYHTALDRLVSETQAGGGVTLIPDTDEGRIAPDEATAFTGRTPSTNPPWMQSIVSNEGVGRPYVLNAIEKAKAGKRLGEKQKRVIQIMLDEIDNPSEYEGQTAPEFALEQEQDGVVPEAAPEPTQQQEVDADIGVPGDMFSTGANQQVDLVDETRAIARKEGEVPAGMKLRESKPSELNDLVTEAEGLIEKYIEQGETDGGMDQTAIVGAIQKLRLNKHPRAADLEQIARDAIEGKGPAPTTEAAPLDRVTGYRVPGSIGRWFWRGKMDGNFAVLEKGQQTELVKPKDLVNFDDKELAGLEVAIDEQGGIDLTPKPAPPPGTFVIDEAKFEEEGPDTNERVFSNDVNTKKRVAIDTKLKREGNQYISLEEADAQINEWEAHAMEQAKISREGYGPQYHKDNFNRVIISLFDTTGVWANPYALAGYDVRTLDINNGVDVTDFSTQYMDDMFGNFDGKEIYGVLAACPCTTFSNSSTRWRKDRHENTDPVESRKWIEEMWGKAAAEAKNEDGTWMYESAHAYAIALVNKTMQTLEYFRPKFWTLENPEGRIEQAANLPGPWRTGFQPSNFGDPYTKRTLLWGNFDDNLPTANVDPILGSKMHMMPPSADRAAKRAETPEGFAYAFFMANNYLDKSPLERTKEDYWYIAGAVEEAFRAGVTEEQIREKVYIDEAYEPENGSIDDGKAALRELIDEVTGGPPPTPPGAAAPAAPIPSEAEINAAAAETNPNPTEGQIEAENYKKGRLKMAGFGVAIENAVGSVRYGKMKMRDIYGHFEKFEGADKDKLDVFVNPKAAEDFAGDIYVVDQYIDGKFDEHKVMLGYNNMLDAKRAYKRNYQKGWKGLHNVTKMTTDEFRTWASALKKGTNQEAALSPVTEEGRKAREKANKDMRYASGKDLLGAPTNKWIDAVLEGGERKMGDMPDTVPLNMAVSELLKMQEQREGAPAAPARPSFAAIQKAVQPIEDRLPGAPATLLHNYKQAPAAVVKAMQSQGMEKAKAVYDPNTNEIYMFADQIESIDEGVRTALHEKAHRGLRVAFGERLNPLLDDIFKNVSEKRTADMQTIADEYKLDPGNLQDRRIMAEELLAHMAENNVNDGMVKRAIAFIRKLLREMGIVQEFTDNDIRAIIREAQGSISRNRPTDAKGIMIEEEVIVEGSEEIYIVEQDADVMLTGVDQRIEICKKLRKCL